jgi:hypothetical protein
VAKTRIRYFYLRGFLSSVGNKNSSLIYEALKVMGPHIKNLKCFFETATEVKTSVKKNLLFYPVSVRLYPVL